MVIVNIKGKPYKINTSWKDLTYKQFKEIVGFDKENDHDEFFSIASGLPYTTIKVLSQESYIAILNLITFVNDFEILEAYNISPLDFKEFNIGSQSWHKLEKAKQAIQSHKVFICSIGQVINIYTGKDISDMKLTDVWGEINFFINQINSFFENYKRLSEHEEDPDEFMANVARFEQFGFFGSCVELSRKMGKGYNEVLAMSANEIYQTFLYDFEKADYEKILKGIRSRNNNAGNN